MFDQSSDQPRASHPGLARLYRLGAVPAQRALAWRNQAELLAALDPALDGAAGDSDARLQALVQAPALGQALLGALARLGVVASVPGEVSDALTPPTRRPQQIGAARVENGAPAGGAAGLRRPASRGVAFGEAESVPAGSARASRSAPSRSPFSAQGSTHWADEATNAAATGQAKPAPSPWPLGTRRALPPATPTTTAGAADGGAPRTNVSDQPLRLPSQRAIVSPIAIAAAAAAGHFDTEAARAGLRSAWHQVVQPKATLATSPVLAPLGGGAAMSPASADGWAANTAPGTVSSPVAASDGTAPGADSAPTRLARALDRLAPARAAASGAPGAVPAAAFASPAQTRASQVADSASVPLQAARVGGFRGLAALGRTMAPNRSVVESSAAAPASTRSMAAMLDPQSLIDQIEAALREQAARSGIALDGGAP